MQNQPTAFDVERTRAALAQALNFDALRRTYVQSYPQIPDLNSPKLWDTLNLEQKPLITNNPMEDERLKTVAGLISGTHLRVINVGFGSGNLEQMYFREHSQASNHWYGIDISSASVHKVQREYPTSSFSVGNICAIKFPKEYFDCVIALEVLEHIPPSQTLKALSEVWRVAKPGGQFILSVPLNEGLEEMVRRGENPNAHVRIYTPALIKGELRIAGFRVLDEKVLFAFHRWHTIKSVIAKHGVIKKWRPNNIVILAQKPDSLGCGDRKYRNG